jgi:hypothetical protein
MAANQVIYLTAFDTRVTALEAADTRIVRLTVFDTRATSDIDG